jgi:hypothetical protein
MDDDDATTAYDDDDRSDAGESWLAEQARLILLEDG